jgi:hypothetical protein
MKKIYYKELYEKSLECINTLEECICKLQDQLNRRFIDYEKLYIDYKILSSENKKLVNQENKIIDEIKRYVINSTLDFNSDDKLIVRNILTIIEHYRWNHD